MDVDDIIEQTAGLGRADLESVVPIITVMARAYTRGNGFTGGEPNDELAAVITTAASRLAANPSGISRTETAGTFSRDLRGAFGGWTIAERLVLDRYRVKAM